MYNVLKTVILRNMPDVHETGADRQNLKNNYRQADSRHCDREACVNGSNTHKDVVRGDSTDHNYDI